MKYSNNFLDVLFNDKKVINLKNKVQRAPTSLSGTERTLIFSTPLKTAAEKELLANILAACQLEPSDYLLVPEQISYAHFSADNHIQNVLIFGVPEPDLDISVWFPYNMCFPFAGRIVIKTHTITEIMANKQLKNDLWQKALKPRFISAT